jgi:DNA-binding NarL/FixJ family response regulator
LKSIVIIADSSFVIETVRLALRNSARLKILGKVEGRTNVGRPISEHQPDIVLVDEMQDPRHALARIRECREALPSSSIVLLSMRMDDEWVVQALDAGADAIVSKGTHLPTLGTLIREVVDRNVISALPPSPAEVKLSGSAEELTAREREILGLVADGLTNARIGKELWVTEQTVKFHLSNVYRKLEVSNRTEASRYAHINGITRRPRPQLVGSERRAPGKTELSDTGPVNAGAA